MQRWLIIADDLTGAADCAIAFAKRGVPSAVSWADSTIGEEFPVLAVDADSRRLSADEAAHRQRAVLTTRHRPGHAIYKKIDSTLRGQPAAETAALLAALRAGGQKTLAVVSPAFPATGRTTEAGHVLVQGKPLEETALWALDHTYASANLAELLATAGLRAVTAPLDLVREGSGALTEYVIGAARDGLDAVVCDAATEADLKAVAAATAPMADHLLWVGSGGLGAALAELEPTMAPSRPPGRVGAGGILFVVGSLAEASRAAAAHLISTRKVRPVSIPPAVLLGDESEPSWQTLGETLSTALAGGEDVLVEIARSDDPDLRRGAELTAGLARLLTSAAPRMRALVATGGETACALLGQLGVQGIRLFDEVEPGVPLGVTIGDIIVPVITKAGAFGGEETFVRCRDRLHALNQDQDTEGCLS